MQPTQQPTPINSKRFSDVQTPNAKRQLDLREPDAPVSEAVDFFEVATTALSPATLIDSAKASTYGKLLLLGVALFVLAGVYGLVLAAKTLTYDYQQGTFPFHHPAAQAASPTPRPTTKAQAGSAAKPTSGAADASSPAAPSSTAPTQAPTAGTAPTTGVTAPVNATSILPTTLPNPLPGNPTIQQLPVPIGK